MLPLTSPSEQLRKDMAQRPVLARDFMGIGMAHNLGDSVNGDTVIPKQNLSPGAADGSLPPPLNLNHMVGAGIENSAWSKAATMQNFLSLRGSPDDGLKEQIAESLPERSFPRIVHPLQMQDNSASYNHKNGLCIQEDSLVNGTREVPDESGCSKPILGGLWASSARTNMISPFKLEAKAVHGIPAASEMRLPSSGMTDMEHDPPLTIFYGGSVKVFNNVSAKQAEAIMILASVSNGQGNPVGPVAAAHAVAIKSINGKATLIPNDKSPMNLHIQQAVLDRQTCNQLATSMHLDFENLCIPVPSSPIAAAQPMVPTALPHARKASLARFLEKRRERAHSKCPYIPVKHEDSFLPEERLSSSNDPMACYTPRGGCLDKKLKSLIPTWMERVTECSASDMGLKEQKL